MKLLLFGGTFDPPHTGHISLLRNAVNTVDPDQVLVIPAGIPPHKQASATPAKLRLEMCACFQDVFANLAVSDIELCRQGSSYTWHTLQEIGRLYPEAELFLCVGSDMLIHFTEWYRYRDILSLATLVAQDRDDSDIAQSRQAARQLEQLGGKVLFTGGAVENISSSRLRAALQSGQDVSRWIPPAAMRVIRREHLYQAI